MSETYGEWARLFNWLGTTGLSTEEVMQAVTAYQKRKAFENEQANKRSVESFTEAEREQLEFPFPEETRIAQQIAQQQAIVGESRVMIQSPSHHAVIHGVDYGSLEARAVLAQMVNQNWRGSYTQVPLQYAHQQDAARYVVNGPLKVRGSGTCLDPTPQLWKGKPASGPGETTSASS